MESCWVGVWVAEADVAVRELWVKEEVEEELEDEDDELEDDWDDALDAVPVELVSVTELLCAEVAEAEVSEADVSVGLEDVVAADVLDVASLVAEVVGEVAGVDLIEER